MKQTEVRTAMERLIFLGVMIALLSVANAQCKLQII